MEDTFTELYTFPYSPTEVTTQVTTRIQNILQSPTVKSYDVTYKLYRRGSGKLCTLQFGHGAGISAAGSSAAAGVSPPGTGTGKGGAGGKPTEVASTMYCLCDGRDIYELGSEYENVLLKLQSWTLRQTVKVLGSVHDLVGSGAQAAAAAGTLGPLQQRGPKRVSVGMITQGPSTKGFILEIQHLGGSHRSSRENGPVSILRGGAITVEQQQTLQDIVGPFNATLMGGHKLEEAMVTSVGATLDTGVVGESGNLQMAMAYFELFAKI